MTDNFSIAHKYFEAWNAQSSEQLGNLFDIDVKLVDWSVKVSGRDAVILANKNIWNTVPDITATVIDIGLSHANRAYCHIIIKSEQQDLNFSVIDVLSIRDSKIYRIDAYHNDA